MDNKITYIVIGIAITFNVVVTKFIVNRDDLSQFQKTSQIIIVWLIPFIAATVLWFVNIIHDQKPVKKTSFDGGSNNNIDVGTDTGGGD